MRLSELDERLRLGRAVRERAAATVAARGRLAEVAAWSAARAPDLPEAERAFREAVAARVSRMLAFVAMDAVH